MWEKRVGGILGIYTVEYINKFNDIGCVAE